MAVVDIHASAELVPAERRSIRSLLGLAFAGELSDDDWMHTLGGRHVLVHDRSGLVAHAAVVPRTLWVADSALATGYVEGVTTEPTRQGRGLGSLAMSHAGQLVRDHFEMGALSTDRWAFYTRLELSLRRAPFARPRSTTPSPHPAGRNG